MKLTVAGLLGALAIFGLVLFFLYLVAAQFAGVTAWQFIGVSAGVAVLLYALIVGGGKGQ